MNAFSTDTPPAGCGFERCPQEPCIYSKSVDEEGSRVTMPLYVDDGRLYWDPHRCSVHRQTPTRSV